MKTHVDALVIGAGPAGSTTALVLARAGLSVAIVERTAFPRKKVCGEFLSAASLPLLSDLGVADAFIDRAGPEIRRVGLFARNQRIVTDMPAFRGGSAWGRALGRDTLDAMLLDRAVSEGAALWQPWTVVDVACGLNGEHTRVDVVRGDSRETTQLHARVVVAAHGSWDAGKLPSQPDRRSARASDLFGFKAHFLGSRLERGLMPLVVFPGGYGGLVHTDEDRVSMSFCIRRDALARCRHAHPLPSAGDAACAHITRTCDGVRDALDHARLEAPWRSAGPIRPGVHGTDRGGTFMVGNAAGEAHPVVAEGISMAIQSGYMLATQIIASHDLQDARDSYAARWHRAFAPRIRLSAAIAGWAMSASAVRMTLPVIRGYPALLTEGARRVGKVAPASI